MGSHVTAQITLWSIAHEGALCCDAHEDCIVYICIFSSYHMTCSASVCTRSFPGVRTVAVGRLWIGLISPHEEGKKVDINSMIMYHMYIYGIGQTNSCIVFTLLSFIVLQFLRLSTVIHEFSTMYKLVCKNKAKRG